ncbi:MAG: D-beta-D-heptose 7-phosphate kinase / D-beta-D-heptose 1-phosphate adenosyltransferase [Parcubacteria group bacterium Gr01-1014_17]|nr:MAG: D-beta-D-heptose 7-phosphate kinase / D-beta-D-heptose 1-phosphate adenosyltransferase [Parcubacteria group bacterium Gr01-1014_17]
MLLKKSKTDKPILVIGDVILDIYHFGDHLADSEGVAVGRDRETRHSWGGAGLLVRNLLELGQKVSFISLVGDDQWGEYEKQWTHRNLTKYFVRERVRKTVVKERFVVDGKKVFKWNSLEDKRTSPATGRRMLSLVKKILPQCRVLVISDYRHGLLSRHLATQLVTLAKKTDIPVVVDSQVSQRESNHQWYAGADVFCLNEEEARSIEPAFDAENIERSLQQLSKILDSKYIVVKRGERGSVALISGAYIMSLPHKVKAVDSCGAGDAFLAALASRGFPPNEDALRFANFWAALSTTVIGAEPPKYVQKYVRH